MEQILNLIWIAVAIGVPAVVLPRRHDARTIAALFCFLALLFPIVSASDDMMADRTLLDAFAAVLVGFVLSLSLIVISRLAAHHPLMLLLALQPHSDPRSPPRA